MRATAVAIVLLAACGTVRLGAAQESSVSPTIARIGLIGGASFSTFAGPDAAWASMRTGAFAGLAATFPLGRVVFIEPRLQFATRGANVDTAGYSGPLRLHYVAAAVLLGARLPLPLGPVHPYVLAGPTLSYPAECLAQPDAPQGFSWCGPARQFQAGANAGAGISTAVGSVTLDVTALYRRGFARIVSMRHYVDAGLDLGLALMVPLPWRY